MHAEQKEGVEVEETKGRHSAPEGAAAEEARGRHSAPEGADVHPLIDLARDPNPGRADHAASDE